MSIVEAAAVQIVVLGVRMTVVVSALLLAVVVVVLVMATIDQHLEAKLVFIVKDFQANKSV